MSGANAGQLSERVGSWGSATRVPVASSSRRPAAAENAGVISVAIPAEYAGRPTEFIAGLESLIIERDRMLRVVINERTGTVVAGGDVTISSVVISQGDVRVSVTAENTASQPSFISGFAANVRSLVVTNTKLDVDRNSNGRLDTGEALAATVFLDTNNNGRRDTGERAVATDASGNYVFEGLVGGTYHVRVVTATLNNVGPLITPSAGAYNQTVLGAVVAGNKNFVFAKPA